MDEFLRLQWQQAVETYRQQYGLMNNLMSILITTNVAIVGWAYGKDKPRLLLLGAFVPWLILIVLCGAAPLYKPAVYTAVSIEQFCRTTRLRTAPSPATTEAPADAGPAFDGLASTFISTVYGPEYLKALEGIASHPDPGERRGQLRELGAPYTFWSLLGTRTGCLLMVASGVQLLLLIWPWLAPRLRRLFWQITGC